jgi:hypothetical protein
MADLVWSLFDVGERLTGYFYEPAAVDFLV